MRCVSDGYSLVQSWDQGRSCVILKSFPKVYKNALEDPKRILRAQKAFGRTSAEDLYAKSSEKTRGQNHNIFSS